MTTRIVPSFHRFLQFQRSQASGAINEVRNEYLNHLEQFADAMNEEGPFFAGPEPMLVDFILAPFAVRHWVFDHFKGGLGTPAESERQSARWQNGSTPLEVGEASKKSPVRGNIICPSTKDSKTRCVLPSRQADNSSMEARTIQRRASWQKPLELERESPEQKHHSIEHHSCQDSGNFGACICPPNAFYRSGKSYHPSTNHCWLPICSFDIRVL